jgi:uncharacterized protein (TIGR03083 family)
VDEIRLLTCLETDFRRLRGVVSGALGDAVPSCPGWTGADLATHVGAVYLHKVECIRTGAQPDPWAPDLGPDPLATLDEAYRKLSLEFAAHDPSDKAASWYEPDQTVGFWIRRMAQETVIHRIDAELAAGLAPLPAPADLAADGIDEVLVCFLAYGSVAYPDEVADLMTDGDGATVRLDTESGSWLVQLGPDVVTVERGSADADAVIRGPEDAVLRWLWRRVGNAAVELDGNRAVVGKLHDLMGVATQ